MSGADGEGTDLDALLQRREMQLVIERDGAAVVTAHGQHTHPESPRDQRTRDQASPSAVYRWSPYEESVNCDGEGDDSSMPTSTGHRPCRDGTCGRGASGTQRCWGTETPTTPCRCHRGRRRTSRKPRAVVMLARVHRRGEGRWGRTCSAQCSGGRIPSSSGVSLSIAMASGL